MLRFRLHPTSSSLFFGIAVIALWALLWVWFLFSLGEVHERQGRASASAPVAAAPMAAKTEIAAGAGGEG